MPRWLSYSNAKTKRVGRCLQTIIHVYLLFCFSDTSPCMECWNAKIQWDQRPWVPTGPSSGQELFSQGKHQSTLDHSFVLLSIIDIVNVTEKWNLNDNSRWRSTTKARTSLLWDSSVMLLKNSSGHATTVLIASMWSKWWGAGEKRR